jgi:virulence-associated protein VagC
MPQSVVVPIINDGDDQIICLPEGFEIESDQVVFTRVGKSLVLSAEEFDVEAWIKEMRENADPDFMLEAYPPK